MATRSAGRPKVDQDPAGAPRAALPRPGDHPSPRTMLAVGAGATAAVSVGITGPSLWTDEAATISAATRDVGDLWRMAGELDAVHLTYYLLMHLWTSLAGTGELALRAPSAVAVGMAAAGTYVLGTRLASPRVGLWAAVILPLLPRVAWMGVEARPFALATAAGVWATVVLHVALERGRARWWAGYTLLIALAVLLNLYLVLLVAAHAVMLWPDRRRARSVVLPWVLAAGTGLLLAAPMVLVALGQQGQLGENRLGVLALLRNVVVNQWFLGETPTVYARAGLTTPEASWLGDGAWRPAAVALALACLLLVAGTAARVVRGAAQPLATAGLVRWTAAWLLVPTAVTVAYALVSSSYSPRYLAFVSPAVALALAVALVTVRTRPWRAALCLLLVALALPVWVSQRTENAKSGADWRQVAQHVQAGAEPGDAVYFAPRHPDVDGEEVRLTTRGISVAYPEPFEELVDLTLRVRPADAGDLTGRSVPLARVDDEVAAVDRLWVVRRHDYPEAHREADDALLADAGLEVVDRWTGPLDEVLLLSRS